MEETKIWGYEHPEVKGSNALTFFMWDLSRTIEEAFRSGQNISVEESLIIAQKNIDHLLSKYVEIEAEPSTFEGQFIRLEMSQLEGSNDSVIALKTSPELEQKIIDLKDQSNVGRA